MADKKDMLMMQVVLAFGQGCGATEVDEKACAWFYDRYYPWVTKKKKATPVSSPEDVWGTEGKNFLARFKKIGQKAAAGGGPITEATLKTASQEVEEEPAPCPWCPTKPDA